MKRYRQLTLDERYQIQAMLKAGFSKKAIGLQLSRHPSTIFRELKRNSVPDVVHPYLAPRASRRAQARRVAKGAASRKIKGELRKLIESKLRLSWSPEQIAGRLRTEKKYSISHETIYQHVLRDRTGLRYCLRFGGYKHFRFKKSKCAERTRQWKKRIDARPKEANNRSELGHWERDLIVCSKDGASLLTIVDRRSRYLRVRRVRKRTSAEVAEKTTAALSPFHRINKTLTNDNGVEFQESQKLEKSIAMDIYFTDPSSPWQRGTVENTNGLVRQFVGKRTPLENYHRRVDEMIEETLNFRPRKILGYRTPHEIFWKEKLKLMNLKSQFGLKFSAPS